MADDTNFRSYRPADQRWPARGTPAANSREGGNDRNDPLAELARLIGQTDPFGELGQGAPRATPGQQARPAAAARAPQAAPSFAADPYGAPLQFGGKGFPGPGNAQQQPEGFQPAYDPAIYGTAQQQPPGYPSEGYYDDHPSQLPQGDEFYEEDYGEERPRRGMKLLVLVGCLALLGTGATFGYWALFSGGPSGPPPVIKASATPSKVAAPSSGKQINDRVGDASHGERLVSREEQPVDVKDNSRSAPRVVFPGAPSTSSSSTTPESVMANGSPPLPTDPGGPRSAEPRKIRTLTIRPDQLDGDGMPMQRPAAPSPRSAAPSSTAQARAETPVNPAPARPAANAPLSLTPQVASAEPTGRSAFPPPSSTQTAAPTRLAAVPPAAAVTAGAYTVQISSQRSESEAHASFRTLQSKFPALLGDRQPIVRRADLGPKGIYFRAMVGPFASVDQASHFCGSLKSAGGQCVVQRN